MRHTTCAWRLGCVWSGRLGVLIGAHRGPSCAASEQAIVVTGTKHMYRMRALVIHIGEDNNGHFVTVVRRDGLWFLVNDSDVHTLRDLSEFQWPELLTRVRSRLNTWGSSVHPRLAFYEKQQPSHEE